MGEDIKNVEFELISRIDWENKKVKKSKIVIKDGLIVSIQESDWQ